MGDNILLALFGTYLVGVIAGGAVLGLKYYDYYYYPDEYPIEDLEFELTFQMVVRNILFYAGLSWYGYYHFLTDKGSQP